MVVDLEHLLENPGPLLSVDIVSYGSVKSFSACSFLWLFRTTDRNLKCQPCHSSPKRAAPAQELRAGYIHELDLSQQPIKIARGPVDRACGSSLRKGRRWSQIIQHKPWHNIDLLNNIWTMGPIRAKIRLCLGIRLSDDIRELDPEAQLTGWHVELNIRFFQFRYRV